MADQVPEPTAPPETCPKTGLLVYTRRSVLVRKLRADREAGVPGVDDLVIKACGACAGLHAAPPGQRVPQPAPAQVRDAVCRKRRYRTDAEALNAGKYLRATDDRPHRREKRAYPCPKCRGWWHLTSKS